MAARLRQLSLPHRAISILSATPQQQAPRIFILNTIAIYNHSDCGGKALIASAA